MTLSNSNNSTPGSSRYFHKQKAPIFETRGQNAYRGRSMDWTEDIIRADDFIKKNRAPKLHHIKTSSRIFDGKDVSTYINIIEFDIRSYDLEDSEKIEIISRNFSDNVKKNVRTWRELRENDYEGFKARLKSDYEAEDHTATLSDIAKLAAKGLPLKSFIREFDIIITEMDEVISGREKFRYFWLGLTSEEKQECKKVMRGKNPEELYECLRETAKGLMENAQTIKEITEETDLPAIKIQTETAKVNDLVKEIAELRLQIGSDKKRPANEGGRPPYPTTKQTPNAQHHPNAPVGAKFAGKSELTPERCSFCDNTDCEKRKCPWLKEYIKDARCTQDHRGWVLDPNGEPVAFLRGRGGMMTEKEIICTWRRSMLTNKKRTIESTAPNKKNRHLE